MGIQIPMGKGTCWGHELQDGDASFCQIILSLVSIIITFAIFLSLSSTSLQVSSLNFLTSS